MSTIFTKIINREIPADIVYEDDLCLAFKDINPKAPIHILIIPKKEIASMTDIEENDKELLGHLLLKTSEIADQLGISKSGYRLIVNTNEDGGQEVFHLHFHLLGGGRMKWPLG